MEVCCLADGSFDIPRRWGDTAVSVDQALDRHDIRRRYGTPTVSVLIAPIGKGGQLWHRWAQGKNRQVVSVSTLCGAEQRWLATLCSQEDLTRLAVTRLAHELGQDANAFRCEWFRKTQGEREQFWQSVYKQPVTPALRTLCDLAASGDTLSPHDLAVRLLESYADPLAALADLDSILRPLYPAESGPVLLLQPDVAVDVAWLVNIAPGLTQWAFQVPQIALAVIVPPPVWQSYLMHTPESRSKALLREGAVECPHFSSHEILQRLIAAGWSNAPQPVAQVLAEHGADEGVLEAAAQLVHATRTNTAPELARSAAERFLFDFLQLVPETAGRWELNATLDFSFGHRPMEVDLLARSRRLVIEIDGYYHFRDPDAYRRDRSKDYLLQKHGYVVLRFLAEDVLCQLEQVRDRILDAWQHFQPGVETQWKYNAMNSGSG
ncbi:MAG: hypothetical protein KatS3mg107_0012 [Gemmataceae bacterium]|nr:MAG: hypothetical protein KatS3mg107_0012 [Gemmataceae bacterium]